MYSVQEMMALVSENKESGTGLSMYLGDFLDYFYSPSRTTEERASLVKEEPDRFDNIAVRDYAFISATVHKLCDEYKVPKPSWIVKDDYFLDEPYFANDAKGNLRLILLAESPTHFRMRNIFVSENVLSRA